MKDVIRYLIDGIFTTPMNKAKRYNNTKLALNLTGTFLGWGFLFVIVYMGWSYTFESWAYSVSSSTYISLLIFTAIIGIIEWVIFFPLSFYNGYLLEHKYELSNQTLKKYFWENIKGLMVGIVIGVPILVTFYFFLETFKENWWIPVGIFMFVLTIILGRLAPVLIFPLFYKFKIIEDEELASLIKKRCKSVGMKVEGIYQFNMSKNTKKANAAFTGIGKSKRVILGDTLIDNFISEEIDAILAHELGHFKLNHLWKMMMFGTLLTFLGLWIVSVIYSKWIIFFGFSDITQFAVLPLLGLIMGIYGLVTGPIQNSVSRHHEREADQFSRELLGNSKQMIAALEKLAEQNLADRDPHPVVEFLFHSHPSIKHRIERLEIFTE
ncbi:MAG: M48 family metallopeptidase [Candidatus Marinimicrobia bacterium]|nr:M48 family metallopeptidase [Candidatus Neomarinimicrobiota bacterium]